MWPRLFSSTHVDSKNQNKVHGSAVAIQLAPRIYSPDQHDCWPQRLWVWIQAKPLLITLLVILLSTCAEVIYNDFVWLVISMAVIFQLHQIKHVTGILESSCQANFKTVPGMSQDLKEKTREACTSEHFTTTVIASQNCLLQCCVHGIS